MENTYTYVARNADDPAQVVTFTLYDHSLSVGPGAPLEHVERAVQSATAETEAEAADEEGREFPVRPWLKPTAISLLERGTHPFDVTDVDASVQDDWLHVRAWFRSGGLRLLPITLVRGRVDNPDASRAFVEELERRKASTASLSKLLGVLDYWATWLLAGFLMVVLMQTWRRRKGGTAA
jgi:hypothetical protein